MRFLRSASLKTITLGAASQVGFSPARAAATRFLWLRAGFQLRQKRRFMACEGSHGRSPSSSAAIELAINQIWQRLSCYGWNSAESPLPSIAAALPAAEDEPIPHGRLPSSAAFACLRDELALAAAQSAP